MECCSIPWVLLVTQLSNMMLREHSRMTRTIILLGSSISSLGSYDSLSQTGQCQRNSLDSDTDNPVLCFMTHGLVKIALFLKTCLYLAHFPPYLAASSSYRFDLFYFLLDGRGMWVVWSVLTCRNLCVANSISQPGHGLIYIKRRSKLN